MEFHQIFGQLQSLYNRAMKSGDATTQDWFLSGGILPIIGLVIGYLTLVSAGPKVAANFKPFKLRSVLVLYNIFLVGCNAYFIYECVSIYVRKGYSWSCQVTFESAEDKYRLARVIWLYYISKLVEFMDTVFFILRAKNDQITFLHVYHHSSMLVYMYIITKWYPTGIGVTIVAINSLIHVIMYTYYALAAIGPVVSRFLWWKKYLTMFQLMQFVIFLWFGINGLQLGEKCQYPVWLKASVVVYMMSFLVLFSQFYVYTYWKGAMRKNKQLSFKQYEATQDCWRKPEGRFQISENILRQRF